MRRFDRVPLDVHTEEALAAPVTAREDLHGSLLLRLGVVDGEQHGLADASPYLIGEGVALVVKEDAVHSDDNVEKCDERTARRLANTFESAFRCREEEHVGRGGARLHAQDAVAPAGIPAGSACAHACTT